MKKPFCTIYGTCGYTRVVIKQVRSGLHYYVKRYSDDHWFRIEPSELMDYVSNLDDLSTEMWYLTRRGWKFFEGLPVEIEKQRWRKRTMPN